MRILIPTGKCSSRPSSKKLLFAMDEDYYGDPQLSEVEKKWLRRSLSPTDTSTTQPLDLVSEETTEQGIKDVKSWSTKMSAPRKHLPDTTGRLRPGNLSNMVAYTRPARWQY